MDIHVCDGSIDGYSDGEAIVKRGESGILAMSVLRGDLRVPCAAVTAPFLSTLSALLVRMVSSLIMLELFLRRYAFFCC